MDVNFSLIWDYLVSSTGSGATLSPYDLITNDSGDLTSTDDDGCRPYACTIVVSNIPQPSGCGDSETYTFTDFRYEQISGDLREGTLSVTGKCNVVAPTVART
jgi:hypothetical protein